MLFHSQFWVFLPRKKAHWTKHWRATVALFCVTSILHLKSIQSRSIFIHLWDEKNLEGKNTYNSLKHRFKHTIYNDEKK